MSDRFVESSTRGWGGRLFDSIKGVLVGIVFFLLSFPLLWWNEGRAVQTSSSLGEGEKSVVQVSADSVAPGNEGRLVHVSGMATTAETLTDPVFAVSLPALRLVREVEMFEWNEEKKDEKTKNAGGSETTTTTYTYDKKWSGSLIRSEAFKKPVDHHNPGTMPYDGKDVVAASAKLGAFAFPEEAIKHLAKFETVPFDAEARAKLSPELQSKVQPVEGRLYLGTTPSDPQIGDVRISFKVVRPQVVSVVARQTSGALRPYRASAGDEILLVEPGAVEAKTMFKEAEAGNATLTWILRGVGFLLMAIGMGLFFRPIATAGDFIPMIGNMVGVSTFVFAFFVAAALTSVTIAMAWIAHRPLLGAGVFVAGVGGLAVAFLMMRRTRRKRRAVA
jgi:hypothetical protein